MPMPGSKLLRVTFLLSVMGGPAFAQYGVENDQIAASLTGRAGDPVRGAALFANRQISTCVLCHPERPSPDAIGPSLAGVGGRLSEGQIRLRIVDAARVNPDTVMPSFYRVAGLNRVGRQWLDKPILDAEQIEDLVAFLAASRS